MTPHEPGGGHCLVAAPRPHAVDVRGEIVDRGIIKDDRVCKRHAKLLTQRLSELDGRQAVQAQVDELGAGRQEAVGRAAVDETVDNLRDGDQCRLALITNLNP